MYLPKNYLVYQEPFSHFYSPSRFCSNHIVICAMLSSVSHWSGTFRFDHKKNLNFSIWAYAFHINRDPFSSDNHSVLLSALMGLKFFEVSRPKIFDLFGTKVFRILGQIERFPIGVRCSITTVYIIATLQYIAILDQFGYKRHRGRCGVVN